jgi:hypothetical protein
MLPEKTIEGTHYTEPELARRLATFHAKNQQEFGDFVLCDFFKENKVDILELDLENTQN